MCMGARKFNLYIILLGYNTTTLYLVFTTKFQCLYLLKSDFATEQGTGQFWLYLLASQGYCVVAIDSRGSHHRGVQFEGHIRGKMVTR